MKMETSLTIDSMILGFESPFPTATQVATSPVGVRFDAGKLRHDLVPGDSYEELVKVYTKGAVKYADRNWEKGMKWGRVFGSLLRHAWKFWRGESYDEETGCHHMAMVAWNALALCSYDMRKVGEDDRSL